MGRDTLLGDNFMSNYKEIAFEDFIEQQLTELHGYRGRMDGILVLSQAILGVSDD